MGQYLGQHFLSDEQVLGDIVSTIDRYKEATATAHCIEIGPGAGALTQYLLPLFDKKILFEKDQRLQAPLQKLIDENTTILWGDVLQESALLDDATIDNTQKKNTLVVGNLPYYITSPIFTTFFVDRTVFPGGVFLIQKEVAQKLATNATRKSYLWWLVNYYYTIEYCFTVDKSAFSPPPKVQSAVVGFMKRPAPSAVSFEKMLSFLEIVSPFSRKTLGKIQKMRAHELGALGVTLPEELLGKRLEQLGRKDLEIIL